MLARCVWVITVSTRAIDLRTSPLFLCICHFVVVVSCVVKVVVVKLVVVKVVVEGGRGGARERVVRVSGRKEPWLVETFPLHPADFSPAGSTYILEVFWFWPATFWTRTEASSFFKSSSCPCNSCLDFLRSSYALTLVWWMGG